MADRHVDADVSSAASSRLRGHFLGVHPGPEKFSLLPLSPLPFHPLFFPAFMSPPSLPPLSSTLPRASQKAKDMAREIPLLGSGRGESEILGFDEIYQAASCRATAILWSRVFAIRFGNRRRNGSAGAIRLYPARRRWRWKLQRPQRGYCKDTRRRLVRNSR